jgi:hypothetical protein
LKGVKQSLEECKKGRDGVKTPIEMLKSQGKVFFEFV